MGTAKNIAEGFQKVFKGSLMTNQAEVAQGILKRDITKMTKAPGKFYEAEARSMAKQANVDMSNAAFKAIRKSNTSALDEAIGDNAAAREVVDNSIRNVDDKYSQMRKMASFDENDKFTGVNNAEEVAQYYSADKNGDAFQRADYYTKAAGAYFNTPGKRAARIGAAAGVYAAGAMGVRMMDGGTATRNSSGERDIAGVPFF